MDSIGFHTEQGRPSYQQDVGLWLDITSGTASGATRYKAMCVFDGNQAAGDVAARLACEVATPHLVIRLMTSPDKPNLRGLLSECLRIANKEVRASQRAVPVASMSGSTGTIVLLSDNTLTLAYVGDSPVFVLESGRLRSLVRDHTVAEELVAAGKAKREQVIGLESILTRCLGADKVVTPTTATLQITRPAIIIAGTDGALRTLGTKGTADLLRTWLTSGNEVAQELAENICREAIRQGSDDNASAGVMLLPLPESPAAARGAALPSMQGPSKPSSQEPIPEADPAPASPECVTTQDCANEGENDGVPQGK